MAAARSEPPDLTPAQRDKLGRVLQKTRGEGARFARDTGQVLPLTAAALGLPRETADQWAARLEAVIDALGRERVIAPMPVEKRPEEPVAVSIGQTITSFPAVETPVGQAVCVFSGARTFAQWQAGQSEEHRPVPMSAQKVALTALAADLSALVVNPLGAGVKNADSSNVDQNGADSRNANPNNAAAVVVPRPALETLAVGGTWLAPWNDSELRTELLEIARPAGCLNLTVRPVLQETERGAALLVRVAVYVPQDGDLAVNPRRLANLLATLGGAERLRSGTWAVEFAPVIAHPA